MKNPIQYSLKTEIWPVLMVLAAIGLSLWAYPQLPEQVVSHWGFNGEANGWSSREFHAIFFPALLAVMYALFSILPKFDPNSERYKEFAGAYLAIRNLIMAVLLVIFGAATFSNLGYAINIGAVVTGTIGIMMIVLGSYFEKLKRNWFVGIRTPWTLSSENVWNKTHRLGGILFMFWGFALILIPWLMPNIALPVLSGSMLIIVLWIVVYSYILYRDEKVK